MPEPAPTPANTVKVGSRDIVIERPSGRKASRGLALMRKLSQAMPELNDKLAKYRRDYERNNHIELDRVQAKLRFSPRPLIDTETGLPKYDDAGDMILVPSAVDRMTEADWEAAGGVVRMPASPSQDEVFLAMFSDAVEVAEDHVTQLVALFTIGNQELADARKDGTDQELIEKRAADLLDDGYADELAELALLVAENLDHHFARKVKDMGDRVGNLMRLIGRQPGRAKTDPEPAAAPSTSTQQDSPSSTKPTSSTDSDEPTGGDLTPPSTPASTSSSNSGDSPSSTPSPSEQPEQPQEASA